MSDSTPPSDSASWKSSVPSANARAAGAALAGLALVHLAAACSGSSASDVDSQQAVQQQLEGGSGRADGGNGGDAADTPTRWRFVVVGDTHVITPTTAIPSEMVSFIVAENPSALAASYKVPEGTVPAVANRLKMAKTSNVIALVESGGKLYSATKEVKVTVGGCGG
jgi:sulfur-oxidizing protein SoxY